MSDITRPSQTTSEVLRQQMDYEAVADDRQLFQATCSHHRQLAGISDDMQPSQTVRSHHR